MKPTSLLRKPLSVDRSAMQRTALYSLCLLFAAHAFCFFNLTYSGSSVMLDVSSGRAAQIACGHYLQPIYFRLRGGISAPLFVGMLSALYLTAMNLILVWLLRLRSAVSVFALCGATTVNAAVLSVCAASLHTADAAFLSLLLAALGCALGMRVRLGAVWAVPVLTCALALDTGSGAFFAAATLIVMISDLLLDGNTKAFLRSAASLLFALCAAVALHQLGQLVMLRRSGSVAGAALSLFGGDPIHAYLAPLSAMFAPLTAYARLSAVIRAALVALALVLITCSMQKRSKAASLALVLGVLLFPLAAGMTFLTAQQGVQIIAAHCLLDVLLLIVLVHLAPKGKAGCRLLGAAFTVLFMGSIVFSNQVYLKKNLEFESTISLMSRVVSRMEQVEGYRPGYTPVAFIGTPESSALSVGRKGFEHLDALDAAKGNYAITSDTEMIWYMWDVMGYPVNFVSLYDLEQIIKTEAVQAMPVFPQDGCCAYVGDTLVVRLSP